MISSLRNLSPAVYAISSSSTVPCCPFFPICIESWSGVDCAAPSSSTILAARSRLCFDRLWYTPAAGSTSQDASTTQGRRVCYVSAVKPCSRVGARLAARETTVDAELPSLLASPRLSWHVHSIFAGDDSDLSDLDEGDLAPPSGAGEGEPLSDAEMDEEGDEDAAETAAIEAEAEAEALRQEQARERMEEENDADYAGGAGPSGSAAAAAREGALPSFRKEGGGGAPKKKRPAGDGGERPK